MKKYNNFKEEIRIDFILQIMNMYYEELVEYVDTEYVNLDYYENGEHKLSKYKDLINDICSSENKLPVKMLNFLMYECGWVNNIGGLDNSYSTYALLASRKDLTKKHIYYLLNRNNFDVKMHKALSNNKNFTRKMLLEFIPFWAKIDNSDRGAASIAKKRIELKRWEEDSRHYFIDKEAMEQRMKEYEQRIELKKNGGSAPK